MSTMAPPVAPLPAPDPVVLLDAPLYEVVDGLEVELPPMSVYSIEIACVLMGEFYVYLKQNPLGRAVSEVLFRMFPGKGPMRRPDVAYVPYQRWARDRDLTTGNGWEVVPDLAVEVVSPTDPALEVMTKVYEYLTAGVVEVWVIYPELRRVHRYGPADAMSCMGPAGTLDGGAVLPGFQLPLGELFRNKGGASGPGQVV